MREKSNGAHWDLNPRPLTLRAKCSTNLAMRHCGIHLIKAPIKGWIENEKKRLISDLGGKPQWGKPMQSGVDWKPNPHARLWSKVRFELGSTEPGKRNHWGNLIRTMVMYHAKDRHKCQDQDSNLHYVTQPPEPQFKYTRQFSAMTPPQTSSCFPAADFTKR